ncbi:MAG: hypothetical protein ACJA2S_002858 [Cyclobacteriaceae bacterium]|jgi:hypothetical protein
MIRAFFYICSLLLKEIPVLMSNVHLNILIQLAKIDGVVVQEEIDLINEIGRARGMTEEEISECFNDHFPLERLKVHSDDEKFEFVYSIVQLMKIDGRLYDEEIKFCGRVVAELGYHKDVLFELILKVCSDPHLNADKGEIKKQVQSFLTA